MTAHRIHSAVLMLLLILACLSTFHAAPVDTEYLVGVGIGDITGVPVDVPFYGYANLGQIGEGIQMRQYARAFIIADAKNPQNRVVYVSTDSMSISQNVKRDVVDALQRKYGNVYSNKNVAITATHTHSTPGGFEQYILYQATTAGYQKESAAALASGIYNSISRAHESLQPGRIDMAVGELLDASINRSPFAYDQNPESEKQQYKYNTNKEMTLLKFSSASGELLGALNWYAVHGTSVNSANKLVSGDNKGYAAYAVEKKFNPPGTLPGKGKFVAGFGLAAAGDVSPNTLGPTCPDGSPCDYKSSSCNGKSDTCIAKGPGWEKGPFEPMRVIGQLQADKAIELINKANKPVTGPIDARHTFFEMPGRNINYSGQQKNTCKAAMGYSFAAGTTDGPGLGVFTQNTTQGNLFWNTVRTFIHAPSREQKDCQRTKEILLDTGEIGFPYAWQPSILEAQIIRVGSIVIAAVPAEFTTMSGRRLSNLIKQTLQQNNTLGPDGIVIVAGPSNMYSSYVATPEEYVAQRYEGGSTAYGPVTLPAHMEVFNKLALAMAQNQPVEPGPSPPDYIPKAINLLLPNILDVPHLGKRFGDVITPPSSHYPRGSTVEVKFVGANPRNNLHSEDTYLTVEKQVGGRWVVVRTDADFDTHMIWKRTIPPNSQTTIKWFTGSDTEPGTYRIGYRGESKALLGSITPFQGYTAPFIVQ
ncbi:uncharacterized protein VTP21DRAFT_5052 [Calcarisporiella thermophila]|uniref:uncharacterized protein n=1 Tax=Calcarisporiella thermophila TaxID=911321 RepID=UPI003743DBEB